jgi:catechol 2,3-dioxygenase-like lactoylglutathione lyase family enzyme
MGILEAAKPAIVICTRDRARSTAFYRDTLGITLAHEDSSRVPTFALSPRFFTSGGQAEYLHFLGILPVDDEFRKRIAPGRSQEKFREAPS